MGMPTERDSWSGFFLFCMEKDQEAEFFSLSCAAINLHGNFVNC